MEGDREKQHKYYKFRTAVQKYWFYPRTIFVWVQRFSSAWVQYFVTWKVMKTVANLYTKWDFLINLALDGSLLWVEQKWKLKKYDEIIVVCFFAVAPDTCFLKFFGPERLRFSISMYFAIQDLKQFKL